MEDGRYSGAPVSASEPRIATESDDVAAGLAVCPTSANAAPAETRVSLDQGTLPPRQPGVSLLAKVEALDAMRQVVAKSEQKSLPRP
jgi:mRNA-degrading endonuclease toxin of MazEF toxin-antitoxin module